MIAEPPATPAGGAAPAADNVGPAVPPGGGPFVVFPLATPGGGAGLAETGGAASQSAPPAAPFLNTGGAASQSAPPAPSTPHVSAAASQGAIMLFGTPAGPSDPIVDEPFEFPNHDQETPDGPSGDWVPMPNPESKPHLVGILVWRWRDAFRLCVTCRKLLPSDHYVKQTGVRSGCLTYRWRKADGGGQYKLEVHRCAMCFAGSYAASHVARYAVGGQRQHQTPGGPLQVATPAPAAPVEWKPGDQQWALGAGSHLDPAAATDTHGAASQAAGFRETHTGGRNGIYHSAAHLLSVMCPIVSGIFPLVRDNTLRDEYEYILANDSHYFDDGVGAEVYLRYRVTTGDAASQVAGTDFVRKVEQDHNRTAAQIAKERKKQLAIAATPADARAAASDLLAAAGSAASPGAAAASSPAASAKGKGKGRVHQLTEDRRTKLAKSFAKSEALVLKATQLIESLGDASQAELRAAIPNVDMEDLTEDLNECTAAANEAADVHAAGETPSLGAVNRRLTNTREELTKSMKLVNDQMARLKSTLEARASKRARKA